MLGSPTAVPPPSLVNALMESTEWFDIEESMDTVIDDVLNDQLDIDELLEEAEQEQQYQQQPAAPLIYWGKPLWHTRKPPSPKISPSESESTSTYDAEAESMLESEHIREQQSMEIKRLQQVLQQHQLQMEQQQLEIQEKQVEHQQRQERQQYLGG
ncbi:putative uncharacterized protein DDB_G0271606 [Microplitis demolitor]|uniref:putative uncharacterized protein DDB_G0271606 n=1 Tax=Microplitis demolitor TaxID=69319 RepID=UPI00235B690A|nr:putative uncharacterized protein DDB_G0271606 [Microplitis demolitor]